MNENLYAMNLQLFAEDGGESSVNAESVGNVEPQQTTTDNTQTEQATPTESVKVDTANPQVEEKPVQTQEENAKYAAIRRDYESKLQAETQKARQVARDEFVASQGFEWNGKPIKTEAEYNQALLEKEYQDKGIDPNLLNEAIEKNPILKQAQDVIKQNEEKERQNKEFMDFLQAYPNTNPQEIKQEVWLANKNGVPLKLAYAAYQENETLKAKISEYEKGQKTQQINNQNAQTATGSVANSGNLPVDFISKDVFEANKKDQNWLNKNYDLLKNSMNKWK